MYRLASGRPAIHFREIVFAMSRSRSSHTAFTELPIVDISLLFSDKLNDRQAVAKELDRATRDAGFFYLKGHGVKPELIDSLKRETKRYFAQDTQTKMANYIGFSNNHSGYVPQGEEQFANASNMDLKEAYDIGPESSSLMARFVDHGSNQWPQQDHIKHPFKNAVAPYYSAMLNLSKHLFRGFALALNLPENSFTQHLSTPPSQLRLIHYFDNPNAQQTDSGIGAHTDYEFFTILLPTAPGLQALNGNGEWINIPVLPDCFVINIGDMMQIASNGEYVATSHRVREVKQERYAFPFFASLDYETLVQPATNANAENTVSTGTPTSATPVSCGDHLLAQTIQTFSYLKTRLENGEVAMQQNAKALSSFGLLGKTPN